MSPDFPFLTIGAGIAAAGVGDRIYVMAKTGKYDEAGLTIATAGVGLFFERGAILEDTGGGDVLTITAQDVTLNEVFVDNDDNGGKCIVAAGATITMINCVAQQGTVGFDLDGVKGYYVNCMATDNSTTQFDVKTKYAEFFRCVANGDGQAVRGFYLSDNTADLNTFVNCHSLGNTTAGWETVAGADENLFTDCSMGTTDGARTDAGTNNSWVNFGTDFTNINNSANVTPDDVHQKFAALWGADGANVFNPTIDGVARTTLEAALEALAGLATENRGLVFQGTVSAVTDASNFKCAELGGFGDNFFNTNFYVYVIHNADNDGAAPEGEIQDITDYVSTDGSFVTGALTAAMTVGDEIYVVHEALAVLIPTFDSSGITNDFDGSIIEIIKAGLEKDTSGAYDADTDSNEAIRNLLDATIKNVMNRGKFFNRILYVDASGGNDSNDGLTWANRKLTFTGVSGIDTIWTDHDLVIAVGAFSSENVSVDQSNITILGIGRGTTGLRFTLSTAGKHDIEIGDLELNIAAQTGINITAAIDGVYIHDIIAETTNFGANPVIDLSSPNNGIIENLRAFGVTANNIIRFQASSDGFVLRNIYIGACTADGVAINGGPTNWVFLDNVHILNNTGTGFETTVADADNIFVLPNCAIEGNSVADIAIATGSDVIVKAHSERRTTWNDADLDIADGETTILELGAAAGTSDLLYTLDRIDISIVATPGNLTFKLYTEINGSAVEVTDASRIKAATGAFTFAKDVRSKYIKVTVQTDADNASLNATALVQTGGR
jgi:hypothetical protein